MFIVIHCMGLPFNGETIKRKSLGGSETAAYYVAKELAAKGHKVTMFTNSQEEGTWDNVKYVFAGNSTEQTPLGDRFHFYAENTPHDVLIIQRHPAAFQYNWSAKIKLWWVHDLAQVRNHAAMQSNLWNMDGILTVSEFHKKQYVEVYGLNPDNVFVIQNGVDLSLFEERDHLSDVAFGMSHGKDEVALLYSSRPERGLEHLVAPNGIMEKLAAIDGKYHLYVCAYNNTTADTQEYYHYLSKRCEVLPNVTILGSLTKQELADVMRQCDAMVYPTPGPQQPNFEEVSCITAMECMAAGLPFISTTKGALPETCKDSGSILLELNENGVPDVQVFVDTIIEFEEGFYNKPVEGLTIKQLQVAKKYDWSVAAGRLMFHIENCMCANRSDSAKARHMLHTSDIYALGKFSEKYIGLDSFHNNNIFTEAYGELQNCYNFAFNDTWEEHYEKYYEYEKERGIDYGAENLDGNPRFEHVSGLIKLLNVGATIIDYGCAHGHYTINLAKRFKDKTFIGIDITKSNVDKANQWCKKEGVKNARFIHGAIPQQPESGIIKTFSESGAEAGNIPLADCIIAAEVIEHIGNPAYYVDTLVKYLKSENSNIIITTPYGPWEAIGYEEHHPWRAHVHHFEREDLHDLWSHFPEFQVAVSPSGNSKWGSSLGSYITTFKNPNIKLSEILEGDVIKEAASCVSGSIDCARKFENMAPRQTVSTCLIVKDAEDSLKRCLDSIKEISDEIIIALDETTTDNTAEVISNFKESIKGNWPIVRTISIESPTKIGFDAARNISIESASGDWILWLDSDEVMINPKNIFKYLHNNQYNGYAIKQHHFTIEPLGVMKTDMPCRLFRNHRDVKFYGVVHEHPEAVMNKGVGFAQLLPDLEIAHYGYSTEQIRRGRFDRNIHLLVRDREKYPERKLGMFLWLRDLSQMCKYELELNGGKITPEMKERAKEGIKIWEELLVANELRMLVDGMEFYSMLTQIQGGGFEMGFTMDTSKANGGVHLERARPVKAYFANKKHATDFLQAVFNEKVKTYESKYF